MKIIRLLPVNLGIETIRIPVFEEEGGSQGKTLLITAGMDGDEYAGIEAAYQIIKKFQKRKFIGRLIVVPIVNIAGFQETTSLNPLDNQYPKFIFPGKKNGTPSERLIFWLNENYIVRSDVWLDLHSGAVNEILNPYLYLYETRDTSLNMIIRKILSCLSAPKIVFEKPCTWMKAELLAKKGIIYILCEAGFSGERKKVFIDKHLEWVRQIMGVLEMIEKSPLPVHKPRIYRKCVRYQVKHSGLWYPSVDINSFISEGQEIGETYSLEGKLLQTIKSRFKGELLWMREGLFCKRCEVVVEMGCEPADIANI